MAAPQLSDRLLSAEEFYELPDPPEGGKMELVCGRVVTHMPVSGEHGEVASGLISALHSFVRANRLGRVYTETGYRVARQPDTVRGPDVSFIANGDMPPGGVPKDGFVPFAPTLAVEVVSPGDLEREIGAKLTEYASAGVSRVWVVRPRQRSVTIHYPDGTARTLTAGAALTSDDAGFTVEGFELRLDELFAD